MSFSWLFLVCFFALFIWLFFFWCLFGYFLLGYFFLYFFISFLFMFSYFPANTGHDISFFYAFCNRQAPTPAPTPTPTPTPTKPCDSKNLPESSTQKTGPSFSIKVGIPVVRDSGLFYFFSSAVVSGKFPVRLHPGRNFGRKYAKNLKWQFRFPPPVASGKFQPECIPGPS